MNGTLLTTLTAAEREKLLRMARSSNLKRKRAELPRIERVERGEGMELSYAQRRLWFLAQMEGVSEAYHISLGLRLRGGLDRAALRRALDRIVERQEGLRTTFVQRDGEAEQRIAGGAESRFALREQDLRQPGEEWKGEGGKEKELERLAEEEARTAFDLEAGPLIRGRLIQLAEEEHVLLITMHHIVSDGWSLGVLLNELTRLYKAFVRGEADPLPELAVQYADYAAWQRKWMEGGVLREEVEYWKENLAGVPELLEIPGDHERPAEKDYAGGFIELELGEELTQGLRALSRRHGATLYMTLLAGWAALLGRLSGQEDVVIGTPVANRVRAEIEGLIGFFVNTLALRVDLSGSPRVGELLERVKESALGGQQHQDIPFEQVVEMVRPARSLAHSPVFQAMFAWQNAPEGQLELEGLEVESLESEAQIMSKFDLTLSLQETGDGIAGGVEYAASLFEATTIERYLGYYRRLLEGMVGDESQVVERLAMLPEEEREQLLYGWNETGTEYPRGKCVHELFEEQVERSPGAVAVVFEEQMLSYGELNRRANRLGHYLRELGVKPDERVGICVERGLEMIVALLGVLKAGGGYVPLDPAYPQERLRWMLEDSGSMVLLTQGHLQDLFSGLEDGLPVIDLGGEERVWKGYPENNLDSAEVGVGAAHLAYVIYTSGSTGKPKGVMVEHANVARLFAATAAWFQFNEKDVWTLFHSYGFDFSVWEIWGALLHGGRLMVVPQDVVRSPEDFYRLICGAEVTILNQTPSAFRQLIAAQAGSREKHQLRYVIFGGEALEVSGLQPWYEQNERGETELVNMYGITETTVHVTYRALEREDAERNEERRRGGGSPIGRPIGNTRVYILDKEMEPVPVGVSGEMYIGGAGVARGYLNRAELTGERFVGDPFVEEVGARMYRTGDLGKWLGDGMIEFVGRNDEQVKVRGYRIELGEIEARMASYPGVGEAVVIDREDELGEKLVAYYTRTNRNEVEGGESTGSDVNAEELRRHVAARLPEYMVPAAYVQVERMPLTPNGKLDRKALPAPDGKAYAVPGYEEPQGEIETTLAGIWAAVLQVERVGRRDNFFALGGDSIRVIRIIAKAQNQGWIFSPEVIFSHPTIAGLGNVLRSGSAIGSLPAPEISMPSISAADSSLLPEHVEDAYSISRLQLGMIFHNQISSERSIYHDVFSFHFRIQEWDTAKFQIVLDTLVQKHPILRTSFSLHRYSEPLQLVHKQARIPIAVFDIAAADTSTQEKIILELMERERNTPFNLEAPPLLRIFIHLRSPDNIQYTLSFHHAIFDGWSVASFQTELFREYAILCMNGGKMRALKPLASKFKTAVALEKRMLQSEKVKLFWARYLEGSSLSSLPPHYEDTQGNSTNNYRLPIYEGLRNKLIGLANSMRLPIRTILLSAHLRVISLLSGCQDIVSGLVSHTRLQEEDAEQVLGLFLNTLPLRVILPRGSWVDLIRATFEAELTIAPYRYYPYSQLFLTNDRIPLFEIVFNYVNFHVYDTLHDVGTVELLNGEGFEATNFPLLMTAISHPGALSLNLEFDPARLSITQVQNIANYYLSVLNSISANPDAPYFADNNLPTAERTRLLYEWNDTDTNYPRELCVHQLFETQAEENPEAVAIVSDDALLTYGELNQRANQLARYLSELGVSPDARVAICAKRGLEMIIALLAVLKTGGAYVPLDPAYPAERLSYMLDDSAPAALLTQGHLTGLLADPRRTLPVIDLADAAPPWRDYPKTNPVDHTKELRPGHLAYVIYTSGSTGTPKGVAMSHGALVNLLSWQIKQSNSSSAQRTLQFAALGFDVAFQEIFSTLCSGSILILINEDTRFNPTELIRFIEAQHIQRLFLPYAALQMFADGLEQVRAVFQVSWHADFALREIITAGEQLHIDPKIAGLFERLDRCTLQNQYGPTETHVTSSFSLSQDPTHWPILPPIGKPIWNVRVYVLDGAGDVVPVGVSGEIYIGGVQVARGYWRRAELTAEQFVPDPYGGEAGARMYRTGDVGRWRGDGTIEFLGRNDDQVKIRGYRIELGEIEAKLREHGELREAVVVAREDEPGEKRLVAYYTRAKKQRGEKEETEEKEELYEGDGKTEAVRAEELRAHVAAALPEYMVPGAYVELEKFPLTPNGKLNRKALPKPEGGAYAVRGYEAPEGRIETTLAEIWTEVLQVEQVGRRDNFFELGGHSLLAVRVMSRVREALQVEARISDLFARPVLEDFARGVASAAHCELPRIERVERGEGMELSYAQRRLWFLAQMEGVSEAYHISLGLRLRGGLDRAALRRALDRIVERQEGLRTTFVQRDGEAEQRIAGGAESRFALREQDLRQPGEEWKGEGGKEKELERLAEEEARTAFDLEAGPLIRGRLIQLAEEEHVLLITMHHIVSDGWSLGVLLNELTRLYKAFVRGEADPLPELAVQYADYAAWQRKWMEGGVLREEVEYWKENLAGVPELLEIPGDHERPAEKDYAGGFIELELGEELTQGLRALSRRHGATLYMTLLAGWAALLGRLSGQEDVVIGTPVANRVRAEIEGLIGFFVNTLALRVDLSGSPRVGELLERVKESALGGQQHQDIPFEQVVEMVRPARSLAHSPVFQAMFAWQNAPEGQLELEGLEVESLESEAQIMSKFDLTLSLQETGDGIAGGVEYAASLFEATTIERYLGYYRRLLEGMVGDESQVVERLAMLPEEEREQLLYGWNETGTEYPRGKCVHELFEEQVERSPGAVAVVFEEQMLSYGELNRRANRLGHYLRELGVKPDERVGICVERGLEMIVALLGVLKAGGGYVPLDPAYPQERLRWMLEDSGSMVLLTQGHLQDLFSGLEDGLPVIDLGGEARPWEEQAENNPNSSALGLKPAHLAYVIYTSGSTGKPKGVMVEHGNVTRLVRNTNYVNFSPALTIGQVSNVAFDASTFEIWGALLNGGRLTVISKLDVLATEEFAQQLKDKKVSTLFLTTALFQECVRGNPGALQGTQQILFGGEVCDPDCVRRAAGEPFSGEVVHVYGPTETTTFASYFPVKKTVEVAARIPIGRPIANTRIYILDGQGEAVPVGVSGELYIGGPGVARGYLSRPELTAERFVPDEYGKEAGARMYRTGDVGKWLGDGTIEFVGRNDEQVKVRGYRIELGEIEARLREHGGVGEAVVVMREDDPGEKRLVAYYTSVEEIASQHKNKEERSGVKAEELRSHVAARLPEYMVPGAYVELEKFPLTPNGKLDRKALPKPEGGAYAVRGYEEPKGESESKLAGIWAEILQVERVGRGDNFFELGGHSLLAVRVMSRIREALQVQVGISDLFARPVLKDFAEGLANAARSELPAIERSERGQRIPLSYAQQRLWFLAQMEGVSEAYHIPFGLRLRGRLDQAALCRALERMVERHEVLRTTFSQIDGEAVQRIRSLEDGRFHLVEHDLRTHEEGEGEGELERLLEVESQAPFDLEAGPLIRGRLIRLAEEEHVLLITMHHIVSDGWSLGVMVNEMSALYNAFERGEADPLPELAVQYVDYAVWQRKWMEGDLLREQVEYWKENLAGAPERLEIPGDHVRPVQQNYAGGVVEWVLERELTQGLRALSRRHGATLYMTLLAGWAALLGRLSGQEDVVIGTPVANRVRAEIEGLIGFFVNTLALRVDLSGSPRVGELLERVKESALGGQQHQDIPFEQVVEMVRPARSLAHSPVFQAMFAWQNAPEGKLELTGLTLGVLGGAPQIGAKFDLTLSLQEVGDEIAGGIEYATSLFEATTIERYLEYLRRLLKGMVADENQVVERLAILPESERHQLLHEWNATEVEYPSQHCLHELFEEQVEKTPEAMAVVYQEESLSYAELNRRANQLGHYLRELGVKPDERVGICVERGLAMVVAVLAVLKAGGAYVPLDPAYPRERLKWMLEDSAPVALLTQADLRELFTGLTSTPPMIDLTSPEAAAWQQHPLTNPVAAAVGLTPRHIAYIIYTSGSTGTPKGIELPQVALVNLLKWHKTNLPLRKNVLQFASFSFDASIHEIFAAWIYGGTVFIASQELRNNVYALLEYLDRTGIEKIILPIIVLQELSNLKSDTAGEATATSLREVIATGEQLNLTDGIRQWFAAKKHCRLMNHYGPSETHVVTAYEFEGSPEKWKTHAPIGRPIANAGIYILDGQGDPVPAGVDGELYIGGVGVARGYLKRTELTAERFLPNPFVEEAGARMYKTGDTGRWLKDGNIEFVGRKDDQVKIRGYRIELGEIEATLAKVAGVGEAAVMVREDEPGEKRLVAYYTCVETHDSDKGELRHEAVEAEGLRAHLAARLPDYMVPAAYVRLEILPVTSNGKLDRKALPAPDRDAYAARGYESPQNELESTVASIWALVLKVDRVGREDDFFALGGHSLLVLRVVELLEQVGISILATTLFAHPTIKSLAAQIQLEGRRASSHKVVCIRAGAEPPLFLAHDGGGSLLYLHQIAPYIDINIPLYGLPSSASDRDPLRTIEAMAIRMVQMIRAIQPVGPYRLAGWSFGGMLAYELATQLIGADQEVSFLGMFDTYYPAGMKGTYDRDMENLQERELLLRQIKISVGTKQEMQTALQEITSSAVTMDFAGLVKKSREMSLMPEYFSHLTTEQIQRTLLHEYVWFMSMTKYLAHPLPIPVHLFAAQEKNPENETGEPLLGWDAVIPASHLRVIPTPGTHGSMILTPNVEGFGRELSRAITEATANSKELPEQNYSPLAALQGGKVRIAALFCVPGAGGSVTSFIELVTCLDPTWTTYGLEPRGLDGVLVPHATVSAAAESYMRAIHKIYPKGSIHLLGHSFGGWVVFEMAQRLRQTGRVIASITIVDSAAPDNSEAVIREYINTEAIMEWVDSWEQVLGRPLDIKRNDIDSLKAPAQRQILHNRLVKAGPMPRQSSPDMLRGPLATFSTALRVHYKPDTPYLGPLQLVLADDPKLNPEANRQKQERLIEGWKQWAPNLVSTHLPGNHMTILKLPHVRALARLIQQNEHRSIRGA